MRRTREDFDQRIVEVNRYFDFLSKLDKDSPVLHFSEMDVSKSLRIDAELFKIIKANGFLLIYNLIESSCRNACLEILSAIQNKNLTYKKLTDQSQKIWLRHKTKKDKEDIHIISNRIIQNNLIEFKSLLDTLLIEESLDKDYDYDKDNDFLGISGNIDARKIKLLAADYGFNPDVREAIRGEDTLLLIKRMRNKLAHGRLTFTESVKDKSVTDMIRYKDETVAYLTEFLNNIEKHISKSNFQKKRAARKI